jgi:fructose/tagatose bisphosphate aldolase
MKSEQCALPAVNCIGSHSVNAVLAGARAAKALYANRGDDRFSVMQGAADLVRLVPLLAVLDAATAAGTVDWLLRDAGRPPAPSPGGVY